MSALYRTVWRWHFYAGLFIMPMVLILATTGMTYLIKPQVERWEERAFQGLPSAGAVTPDAQVAAALAATPGAKLHSYRLPEFEGDAALVHVALLGPEGEELLVRAPSEQQAPAPGHARAHDVPLTRRFAHDRGLLVEPHQHRVVGLELERALALFFWAGQQGDETLQRKALERVAAELPFDVANLSDETRELAALVPPGVGLPGTRVEGRPGHDRLGLVEIAAAPQPLRALQPDGRFVEAGGGNAAQHGGRVGGGCGWPAS